MTPTLSIVIPVYNEPHWIGRVVEDLMTSIERSPFREPELILVDDGSDEATQRALQRISTPFPSRIVRQANQGRLAARRAGVVLSGGDLVLLLDSRVSIDADALAFVADRLPEDGGLPIWNAHVDIELDGNPYARFWNVITEVAFREYFAKPRTTSFGLAEFDRFPKGTTCFLAPREALERAMADFRSYIRGEALCVKRRPPAVTLVALSGSESRSASSASASMSSGSLRVPQRGGQNCASGAIHRLNSWHHPGDDAHRN